MSKGSKGTACSLNADFTLFLGARDFNVDCRFSHRLRVNFFIDAGQCTRHGIDFIVPVSLS